MLELADHSVIPVESADVALRLMLDYVRGGKDSPPELIFMDQSALSGSTPVEFQKKIRTLMESAQVEVSILFILKEDGLQSEDRQAIAEQIEYILKPADISAFPGFLADLRIFLNRLSRAVTGNLSRNTTLVADLAKEHLPSLLQMLGLVGASGYAALTNSRTKQTGTIHLRYGDITKIVLVDTSSSPKRRLEGTEALQALVDWREGVFSFGRADPEKMPPGNPTRWVVLKCGTG